MKETINSYRDNGAIGAILDEYEKSIEELKALLPNITAQELKKVIGDPNAHEDFLSIQNILRHTVFAGYHYVIEIRKHLGEAIPFMERKTFQSIDEYIQALDDMFQFNVQLFNDYPDISIEENETNKKVLCQWGQTYDIEQLYEHAIVHILRHRRQIERYLLKIRA